MGFEEGRLELDSENGAYYAGQTVHGQLTFEQNGVKTFRGIYARMKGYCKVHWTSTNSREVNGQRQTYTENHESHEVYYDRKVYLAGGEDGEHQLQPGSYKYHFEFPIPANCPSSFEGDHGHVRYEVKVVVDRAFKLDQEKDMKVRVVAPLDLNMDPYCREPMAFEMYDTYCCWCVSSGSSETLVKLPVSGFCPGQKIPIEVSCTNRSNVEISTIRFEITREVTFHAHHQPGTKSNINTITSTKKGSVPGDSSRNWTVELDVPAEDVYNLNGCKFIDICYEFKVTVEPDGCHDNSTEHRRIVLGTVPLVGYQDNVANPLQDQMPKITALPAQSGYPVTNQPMPNVIPQMNYPNTSPYPGAQPYPAPQLYPGGNPPYPGANPGYPGVNPPYPGGNPPYPGGNNLFAGGNPPYNGGSPPYPGVNPPYPGTNPPYPGTNPPYPGANPPYPGGNSPYPGGNSPMMGFANDARQRSDAPNIPLLPAGAAVPYPTGRVSPNPYAAASAPTPATPDTPAPTPAAAGEKDPMLADDNPAYNPHFVEKQK